MGAATKANAGGQRAGGRGGKSVGKLDVVQGKEDKIREGVKAGGKREGGVLL